MKMATYSMIMREILLKKIKETKAEPQKVKFFQEFEIKPSLHFWILFKEDLTTPKRTKKI